MTKDSETVKALTTAVHDLDTSRRVGWAKQYEASGRLDEALRDLNICRGDRESLIHYASFMHGLLQSLNSGLLEASKEHLIDITPFMDTRAMSEGQRLGGQIKRGVAKSGSRINDPANGVSVKALKANPLVQRMIKNAYDAGWRRAKEKFGG